jgi:hypothetical protein
VQRINYIIRRIRAADIEQMLSSVATVKRPFALIGREFRLSPETNAARLRPFAALARIMSIGVVMGPRIGVQKGPP